VRGVNINHNELEDLMFFNQAIQDFKAEVVATDDGNDLLRLLVEPRRGHDTGEVGRGIVAGVQKTFEMTPEIVILETGTLGKEFESTIKAARFVDRRG
jgi:phenylacetate-CoA ligase